MATSDSDDFESTDERYDFRGKPIHRQPQLPLRKYTFCVDSDSDPDYCTSDWQHKSWHFTCGDSYKTAFRDKRSLAKELGNLEERRRQRQSTKDELNSSKILEDKSKSPVNTNENSGSTSMESSNDETSRKPSILSQRPMSLAEEMDQAAKSQDLTLESDEKPQKDFDSQVKPEKGPQRADKRQRSERKQRDKPSKPFGLGARKLGSKISEDKPRPPPEDIRTPEDIKRKAIAAGKEPPIIQECWECDDDKVTQILQSESQKNSWSKKSKDSPDSLEDVPEELKSNKSFKELFCSNAGEAFGETKNAQDKDQQNLQKNVQKNIQKHVQKSIQKIVSEEDREIDVSVENWEESMEQVDVKDALDKLVKKEEEDKSSWANWGNWGVTSLLNTASVGVSTLTSHVSQGLTLLEESMGVAAPDELAETTEETPSKVEKPEGNEENEPQSTTSFGLGSLMSGVSSITKLVEETGNKVITGGLGTLETIGKKTMEVLQEGDPGLKKKRAFFTNEIEKPILSQILREAKENAGVAEESAEKKQQARKIHFESLFDDFQGLVHLEALEMLSKQINMKIRDKWSAQNAEEALAVKETLEDVKDLCDLGEEDDEDETKGDFNEKLKTACTGLGVNIDYDKLNAVWEETKTYVSTTSPTTSIQEIFQMALSTFAKFTAYSVERFHKTAELLLVKERRSTVNEAEALVRLTKILSGQIGTIAGSFSKCLTERNKNEEKPKEPVDITTIFLEATNAISYIQDAFRLLIPILQVGAI